MSMNAACGRVVARIVQGSKKVGFTLVNINPMAAGRPHHLNRKAVKQFDILLCQH
jgi:hypothetical protein